MSFSDKKKKQFLEKQQQNPLLISKISSHLFDYLAVEDLKACRLVTRSWHPGSTQKLSKRIHGILLHDKVDWKKFLKLLSKNTNSGKLLNLNQIHPFHSFTFFATYPEDPSSTPYKTAILDYMHAKYRLPRMRTFWDERFFTIYGTQINELKLIQFNLYTEKALREFRELLSTHCPNLTCLTLQLQKDTSYPTTPSSSPFITPTPTPTPSPSPIVGPGSENVFFPPNLESARKTLALLKKFTFTTDNKYYVNPHALEELMSLMPSLEEFTYRYTGAKKQWTIMRKVEIIDVLCNVINAGHWEYLLSLDLDSDGTVLSGEDFKNISKLCESSSSSSQSRKKKRGFKLRKFCCQVFIKNELDWTYFCIWLRRIYETLRMLDIQVRTTCPQLPSEQELPECFSNVRNAKLLLDNNLHIFLKRLPTVEQFEGIYDNELFQSVTQAIFPEEEEKEDGGDKNDNKFLEERPSCPSAKYLRIHGSEEVMLDIEWKARVFCNIQSFETDVYFDNDLRLIWIHLKDKLKKLILHLKAEIPEQAFIGAGLPLVMSFDEKHPMNYHDQEQLAMLDEYPNMSFMKVLEILEIYTGSRQDAYGTQFSASIIIYGVSLLPNLKRVVLPPAIPSKCLESSIRFLGNLPNLRYLSVCDDTFKNVLPFHGLKMELPNLEIVVRYYQCEQIKKMTWNAWKVERLVLPDFLPEHEPGWKSLHKRHSTP